MPQNFTLQNETSLISQMDNKTIGSNTVKIVKKLGSGEIGDESGSGAIGGKEDASGIGMKLVSATATILLKLFLTSRITAISASTAKSKCE